MISLGDLRSFAAKFVDGGQCADSDIVRDRINEAYERMLSLGNWLYTTGRYVVHTDKPCLPLPYEAARILSVDVEYEPREIFGSYYEFHLNGPGIVDSGSLSGYRDLEDLGVGFPTMFDMPVGFSLPILATSSNPEDANLTISVKARDAHGMWVNPEDDGWIEVPIIYATRNADNSRHTLTQEQIEENQTQPIREIVAVRKPDTKASVHLYTIDKGELSQNAGDSTNSETYGRLWFLSRYQPRETWGDVRRYQIINMRGLPSYADDRDDYRIRIDCLVKKRYIPLVDDIDVPCVQCRVAYKYMIQAITAEDAGDATAAFEWQSLAVRALTDEKKIMETPVTHPQVRMTGFAWGSSPNII